MREGRTRCDERKVEWRRMEIVDEKRMTTRDRRRNAADRRSGCLLKEDGISV